MRYEEISGHMPGGYWLVLAGSGRLILVRIHDCRHRLQKTLLVFQNLNSLIFKADHLNDLQLKNSDPAIV